MNDFWLAFILYTVMVLCLASLVWLAFDYFKMGDSMAKKSKAKKKK